MGQEYADIYAGGLAVTATPFTDETSVFEKPNWAREMAILFEISAKSGTIGVTLEIEQRGPGAAAQSIVTSSSQVADGVGKIGCGGSLDRTAVYDAFAIDAAPAQFVVKAANSGTGSCTLKARVEYYP